ncbi:unnamed protein product [marine sediment metagenome]|uniref:Phage tail protein n=1 Tax=marine sediment metagenome TaxID=412755 RepID=X1SZG3_9ZZZZ
MSNISTYLEELWLGMLKGVAADPTSFTVYCGIANDTATPDEMEAGTLTNEITGYEGDRKPITFGEITQVGDPPDVKATIKNSAAIDFESMPAPDTKKVKYAIVCDSATKGEGNILYWCPLAELKTWNAGDTFRIPIDGLVLDLA